MDKFNQHLKSTKGADQKEFQPQQVMNPLTDCKCSICHRISDPDESIFEILDCLKLIKISPDKQSPLNKRGRNKQSIKSFYITQNSRKSTIEKSIKSTKVPQILQPNIQNSAQSHKSAINKVLKTQETQGYFDRSTISNDSYLLKSSVLKHNRYMITDIERLQIEKEVDELRAQKKLNKNRSDSTHWHQNESQKLIKDGLDAYKFKIFDNIEVMEANVREDYDYKDQQEKSNRAFQKLNPSILMPFNEILGAQTERQQTHNIGLLLSNFDYKRKQHFKAIQSVSQQFRTSIQIKQNQSLPQNNQIGNNQKNLKDQQQKINKFSKHDQSSYVKIKPRKQKLRQDTLPLEQDDNYFIMGNTKQKQQKFLQGFKNSFIIK